MHTSIFSIKNTYMFFYNKYAISVKRFFNYKNQFAFSKLKKHNLFYFFFIQHNYLFFFRLFFIFLGILYFYIIISDFYNLIVYLLSLFNTPISTLVILLILSKITCYIKIYLNSIFINSPHYHVCCTLYKEKGVKAHSYIAIFIYYISIDYIKYN